MVRSIREIVTVEEGGVVRLRSEELSAGERVELIVVRGPAQPQGTGVPGRWRGFAGAANSGDRNAADNERIDRDLAREYGSAG